jgi:hypothetical protein
MSVVEWSSRLVRARRTPSWDRLGLLFLGVHIGIILYVAFGWTAASREALFAYLLILPSIVLQWVLNGGVSLVNNIENLARGRSWNDPDNGFEGTFFQVFLKQLGIPATQAQITFILCALMLMFWVAAMSRMILIIPPPV